MKVILDTQVLIWWANIVAQAMNEKISIASIDKAFDAYAIERIW